VVRVEAGVRQGVRDTARAGVGACGGIWMGVGGAVSCGAGVWEREGGVWELCEVSALVLCAGAGAGDVGVVELGAVGCAWAAIGAIVCV
jgi:hypothetical protein